MLLTGCPGRPQTHTSDWTLPAAQPVTSIVLFRFFVSVLAQLAGVSSWTLAPPPCQAVWLDERWKGEPPVVAHMYRVKKHGMPYLYLIAPDSLVAASHARVHSCAYVKVVANYSRSAFCTCPTSGPRSHSLVALPGANGVRQLQCWDGSWSLCWQVPARDRDSPALAQTKFTRTICGCCDLCVSPDWQAASHLTPGLVASPAAPSFPRPMPAGSSPQQPCA